MKKRHWDLLFSDHDLLHTLDAQRTKLNEVVRNIEQSSFETNSDEILATAAASQLVVSPLEVLDEETMLSLRDVKVDVSGDPNRIFLQPGPYYIDGREVTYHVPFRGCGTLLKCKPNQFTDSPPAAVIRQDELRFPYDQVDDDMTATDAEFKRDLAEIQRWVKWVNQQVADYNASLHARASDLVRRRREEIAKAKADLANLGYPIRDAQPQRSTSPTDSEAIAQRVRKRHAANHKYDVALSFAGEDRKYVNEVADILNDTGVSVFYDKFEEVNLWGKDLAEHLHQVYSRNSNFVVIFASRHYAQKAWPSHERQSALSRRFRGDEGRILPVKLDDADIPGLASTIGYIDARHVTPEQLAELIRQKLDDES